MPEYDGSKTEIKETFVQLFAPAALFYMAWWVIFIVFSWFVARHHGLPFSKRDTVYAETMRKSPALAKKLGYDPSSAETNAHFVPFLKYIVLHALACLAAIAISTIFWYNFYLHTAFIVLTFVSATYYGAIRYFNMMTKYYVKTLSQLL